MLTNIKNFFYFIILFILISLFFPLNVNASSTEANHEYFENTDLSGLEVQLTSDGLPVLDKFQNRDNLQQNSWNEFFYRYRNLLVGFSGICTLTFLAMFILNISKLGQTSGNPTERTKMLTGLLWTGIGTGGFSVATILMTMAFKMFH